MLSFAIWVTEQCNLCCKYCYENGITTRKHQMTDNIEEVIKFIKIISTRYSKDLILVTFHGGEPLLNFELIVKYVNRLKIEYDKRIQFGITTNGTILNERIAKFLVENFEEISISIDGIKMIHDKNRVFPSGRGSYDRVIKNIHFFKHKKRIRVRMTVTAESAKYFYDSIRDLYNKGFRYIVPAIAVNDTGWNENTFNQLYLSIKKLINDGYSDLEFLKRLLNTPIPMSSCKGGVKSFNISSQNKIFPCEYVIGIDEFCLGTVKNPIKIFEKEDMLINQYQKKNLSCCAECSYEIYCEATRCKYYNYLNSGNTNLPIDNQCKVEHLKYYIWRTLGCKS